jgi:putative NIF3 family GTP cyclohydrolase 1 type 2
MDSTVKRIAVGAGSGSKLLNNADADLILSGEFSHHEILHEKQRGVHVVLTDHTNTERCFFNHFRTAFLDLLKSHGESVDIVVSNVDRDPLQIV